MANGHGGQRTPANPAPVSPPGALSRRTDGGPGNAKQPLRVMTDQAYGAREDTLQQERSAPMAAQPAVPPAQVPAAAPAGAAGPGFGAPSGRPGEPVTNGAALGPGAGPEALGYATSQQMPTGYLTNLLTQLSTTDTTGTLARLLEIAKQRGV